MGPVQFVPERITSDDVQVLLRRVAVGPDIGFTRRIPDEMPVTMTVRTADGRAFDGTKTQYDGFHPRPTGWDAVEAKLARITSGKFDMSLGREIVAADRSIEDLAVVDLTALLRRTGPKPD